MPRADFFVRHPAGGEDFFNKLKEVGFGDGSNGRMGFEALPLGAGASTYATFFCFAHCPGDRIVGLTFPSYDFESSKYEI